MKAAWAVVARTPALSETLARDWRMAAGFYARFGITEWQFRHGVPADANKHNAESGVYDLTP